MNLFLDHSETIRLTAFIGAILLLGFLQWRYSLRRDSRPARRQLTNLALVAIDTLALRLAFPVLAVAFAAGHHASGGGLLARLDLPLWLGLLVAVLELHLALHWQHRLFHRIPLLWRLHRVHHCDRRFDLTTGVRFQPGEVLLSMAIKIGVVWLIGAHPLAVLIFELALSLGSLWTHTDIALPRRLDRGMRWLFVTPSMHRIHHSTWQPETDSNYGFHLSIWDRLFGSYTHAPKQPERTMQIGLDEYMDDRDQGLLSLLINPFRSPSRR